MESFWLFCLNGIAVAAASNESYTRDNSPVKPVKKMKEVKPSVLCSVIGPYEGIEQYMGFVSKSYEINPALTAEEAVADLQWITDKKEIDVDDLMKVFDRMKEIAANPDAYNLEE